MRILNGIHMVKISFVNVYIVERNDELLLIDTGIPGSTDNVLSYIESIGYKPDDVSIIIITHAHWDHIGGLRALIKRTNAMVAAHRLEREYISDRVNILLEEGMNVKGLRVIHTPGHTPGHICLLDTNTNSLFIGDLMYEENGQLYEIPHKYSRDPERNRDAIRRILEVDFKHVMPSHGNPIIDEGKNAVIKLLRELGKI